MFKGVKSSLFKSALSYSIFNIINAATPFLLIPVMTQELDKEGYGIVAMFTICISFLTPIIGLSVNGALTREYFTLEEKDYKIYVGNCVLIFFVSVLAILGLTFLFGSSLERVTSVPTRWLYTAILITAFQFLHTTSLTLWQVKGKVLNFGLFQICNSLFNLLLSLVLVLFLHQGWAGRLNAWLIISFAMALVSISLLIKSGYIHLTPDKKKIQHALRFSLPLVPHAIGGLFIALSDRLIINNLLGVADTGIYTVAFQLSSVLSILMTAFNSAYVPWLFKHLNGNDFLQKKKIVGLTYSVFGVIIILVIVGSIAINFFFDYIIDVKFIESKKYILFLLLAFGFNGMYLMVTNYLFYANKTILLAKNTLIVSLINIPLCYILTKNWGLTGASLATVGAYFILFISTWVLSLKAYPMPWKSPQFKLYN